ncbi:transcription elongation factor [Dichomitus squalens]|uniref:Transcription elongation factor n=2 Tax=Dichomitus squalens TaxID=114155 RepID=A0A4Q9Q060_9APHY|nr:transcription elongation factor [Dichomitus squalens LYAD-421 SS1]EJF62023.1 transcription elongation factor [Dichomitus squalens LYAD-421 SS1]TBU46045.1 transcription elongation factor [Dichomitus squalens]TBU60331.1 transcription elongation factor [Dichomitus squalens]
MSAAVELKPLVKALNSASTDEETVTILNTLKQQAKITEAVLRESKAGLAVGKLRQHSSKQVSELAKEIVKKWKTEVEREKQASGGKSGAKPPAAKKAASSSAAATPSTPVTPTASNAGGKFSDTRSAKSDGVKVEFTGDKTRDKCAELIYDALVFDSGAPSELILSRAKDIEKTVLADNGGANANYKAKIRSLFVNLKDKNNPGLRECVISGELPVSKLCKMSSADMASEERKAADAKIKEENLFKTLGAGEQEAETDAFQCPRCKQRKCRYRQQQTRSADEPMTTFVTCTVCKNRWKFS